MYERQNEKRRKGNHLLPTSAGPRIDRANSFSSLVHGGLEMGIFFTLLVILLVVALVRDFKQWHESDNDALLDTLATHQRIMTRLDALKRLEAK